MNYDPRITPARPDLAASHLEGLVEAARFVAGRDLEVVAAQAPLRRLPTPDSHYDTEALKGELVTIYEETVEGWCWGQLCSDGYVGWMPAAALRPPGPPATHRIAALRTLVYPGRSIKVPPLDALSFGCRVAVSSGADPPPPPPPPPPYPPPPRPPPAAQAGGRTANVLTLLADGLYVPTCHLAPIASTEPDFVAVAERFVGVPYLWGGKTSLGVDCSGLVQLTLAASGVDCPRDSDMQERGVGREVAPSEIADLRRGDLVFWSGHVAIARGDATLVHANAFHMAVAVEPVADAVRRIAAAGGAITSIRRDAAAPRAH